MKYPYATRTAALAVTLGAGCVLAQTTAPVPTEPTAPVVTDAGPRPAEDRGSAGAIVLENSMVRAQQENAFERSSLRTGVGSIGRGVLRATAKAQVEADLAQAREAEVIDLQGRGAGSLVDK